MTLYHGSTMEVRTPLTHLGRLELDFGQGFYLTKIYKQAVDWALTKSSRKLGAKAFLNTYILDDAVFEDGSFKGISFDSYDIHWLKFIADSRKGKQPWKEFDYVQGGVANDQVINTVDAYVDEFITAEQALDQLKYKVPNHQICILNQEIIDRYLAFVKSETLSENEGLHPLAEDKPHNNRPCRTA